MVEIRIENINPHPKNPRKNLGDLTELTDSIRTFGVLQNLTVVPDEDVRGLPYAEGYTVLCGHRRLAAAKEAGLETVPCIIAEDMDEKTQVSIMLLENMQRSDLTVQEEAQGLQMMLDLGSSIAEIVKETGLSETKVRHRVKMNELDQELLGKKLAAQVSINDLIKLEQIKDIDKRNELLGMLGTNNFDWKYREAVSDQEKQETIALIKQYMPDAEFKDGYYWQYAIFGDLRFGAKQAEVVDFLTELKQKAEELNRPVFILERGKSFVCAFESERTETTEDPEQQRRRDEREKRNDQLREMRDKVTESWDDFMKECCRHSESWFASKMNIILDTLIENVCDDTSYDEIDPDEVLEIMGMDEYIGQALINRRWATLAAMAYTSGAPMRYESTWNYSNQTYSESGAERYLRTADYIELLGYEMSDDEVAFVSGTSELYRRDEE